jgi:hypothetical protein
MITFFEASLQLLAVHRIGNPLQDETCSFSDHATQVTDDIMSGLLMQYFLLPFEKVKQVYQFMHPSGDLCHNEIYNQIFESALDTPESFTTLSVHLAKHLYSTSNHPKIKAGELYVALFENVQVEGEQLKALGLFKSESKESYLKISTERFDLTYEQQGININKLDKGCLIFFTNAAKGYKVGIIDNSPKNSPTYWTDDFLQVKVRQDDYAETLQAMTLFKRFILDELDNGFEVTTVDKVDLLNRTVKYFKEKESFDWDEYTGEVITDQSAINALVTFKNRFCEEFDITMPKSFEIVESAIKAQVRTYSKSIKLDKNFEVKVNGSRELVERGFDNDKAMNYYKFYFKEESFT